MNQILTPVPISKRIKDITGQKFQMLTALFPVGINKSKNMTWACKCECGNECVRAQSLLSMDKHFSSCGCSNPGSTTHNKSYSHQYALFNGAKKRAKKLGREFTIDLEDIVIPETCPCLGVALTQGTKDNYDYSPSLDRIDPSKGYIKGNVWVISVKANRIKNDSTPQELSAVAAAVAAKTQTSNT